MYDLDLQYYIKHWDLTLEGEPRYTATSLLQACIYKSRPSMLKISMLEEEQRGARLMQWWGGDGSAKVFARDKKALLLERVVSQSGLNLQTMVSQGLDTQATKIICQTANVLHKSKAGGLPDLVRLSDWFASFLQASPLKEAVLRESMELASKLLDNQEEECVLHGDLHHGNLLYSDERGWLAIDPKALYGDRAFDFANIVCNPNAEVALKEGRLENQLKIISMQAAIKEERLIDWTIAWAGLSAFWMLEEGLDASLRLGIAKKALGIKARLKS